MAAPARLDRQLRIPEWRQEVLSRARLGVVGDDPQVTSLFLLSAAALGINTVRVIAPALEEQFLGLARSLNPDWRLEHFPGFYSHPRCQEILTRCHPLVDLGHSGLTSKILLEQAFQQGLTIVRGRRWQEAHRQGLAVFTYQRGREWPELHEVLPRQQLPRQTEPRDGVLDIIAAGIMLEEVTAVLMHGRGSEAVCAYTGPRWPRPEVQPAIGIVGAGALGNFVGLGLALAGFRRLTFIDPDVVEVTNLNRQIYFGEAVGAGKAETLACRLNRAFGLEARWQAALFQPPEAAGFDLLFDCVDTFASRIAISEACAAAGTPLVSGGADVSQGQVVAYHPQRQPLTPAAMLDMYGLEQSRQAAPHPLNRAACIHQPNPAVIMTNQVIAGFMVEAGRHLLAGQAWPVLFYDARSAGKIGLA